MEKETYIWQKKSWPNFTYELEIIAPHLYQTTKDIAFFLGKISTLNHNAKNEFYTSSLENEVIPSNAIEGLVFDRESVRSSLMSHLGFEDSSISNRDTDGAVAVTLDAIRKYNKPLTKERLFRYHSMLFPSMTSGGRKILTGTFRKGSMYVLSGRMGNEVVHFEAPPADKVEKEMDKFFDFINKETDMNPLIKAAIAHLYFVTIHPFADGNGRLARAITEMLLARADGSDNRYYSLSSAILSSRNEYYEALEKAEKGTLDVTDFIIYFLKTLRQAIKRSEDELTRTLAKTRFWDSIRSCSLNERQLKIINMLQDGFKGKLTTKKCEKINKCSHSTALRDIKDLIEKGILVEDGFHSKNTSYYLNDKRQKPIPEDKEQEFIHYSSIGS